MTQNNSDTDNNSSSSSSSDNSYNSSDTTPVESNNTQPVVESSERETVVLSEVQDSNTTSDNSSLGSVVTSSVDSETANNNSSSTDNIKVPGGQLASIGERFVAALIDGVIVGLVAGLVSSVGLDKIGFLITIAIQVAYFGYMESSESQATFGKQIMKLKVVSEDGHPLKDKSYVRAGMRVVSGYILAIGFILAFFDVKRQTLHDRIAKSYVVKS